MARYRSAGSLDDPSVSDGDTGFVGINQRDQPNQLQPGEVELSKNGRIDGYWQPRKGIELKSGELATSELPLRLPMWIVDSQVAITSAARSSDVVTLTISGGHGLNYASNASATLDPAGADNVISVFADTSGESETDISVEITDHPTNVYGLDIKISDRAFTIRAGSKSGRESVTMAGAKPTAANATCTLVQTGSPSQDWIWTSDGLAWDGTEADTVGRTVITGEEGDGNWAVYYNNGDFRITSATIPDDPTFSSPVWIDQVGTVSYAVWNLEEGTGLPTGFTLPKAISSEVIDLINSDSTMSSLVTASASGADTGTTGDVSQTYLRGGWGPTAYFTLGDPDVATNPLTGTDNVVPGSYLMTATSDTTITFPHVGVDESLTVNGTYGYLACTLDDDAVGQIFGSCAFSDPSAELVESVLLATGQNVKKILLTDYTVSDIPYPSGVAMSSEVELTQAFDRVYLFRDGQRTLEYIPGGRPIDSSSYTSASGIVDVEVVGHGLSVGDEVVVSDIGFTTTDPNGTHTVSSIVDADNFQYVIATGGGDEPYTIGTGNATASGFTFVRGGEYTQPQAFNIAGNLWGCADNSVRLTVAGNTTIRAGDTITVDATDVTELQPLVGNRYEVTQADSTDIYIYAPIGNFTYATGAPTEYIEFSGIFSQGGGFIHSPAPAWGTYFQRRLWVPYAYTPNGTPTSPTYTDRKIRDEITASDILDPDTFDPISSQFRITAGVADYVVALHPFYEDAMVVFNRNSLHLIAGTQGSLQDTVVRELTSEIGCLARRSVVEQGNAIFFLSDNGVYGISFADEYNLRGSEKPLSEKIQPFIDRINKSLADKAVGVYYNNRYYLAVPLDSTQGADDAAGNNTVLVYNLLNNGWESIDTYGENEFLITNFVIAQDSKRNQLFIINKEGGLHLADAIEDAADTYSLNPVGDSNTSGIDYQLKSRGYGFNSLERKKYRRAQVQMSSDTDYATDVEFLFSSECPDTDEFSVTDVVAALGSQLSSGEPGNIRFRLGNPRGIYGTLTINRKIVGSSAIGRPKITSIFLDGYETNRQTISHD